MLLELAYRVVYPVRLRRAGQGRRLGHVVEGERRCGHLESGETTRMTKVGQKIGTGGIGQY